MPGRASGTGSGSGRNPGHRPTSSAPTPTSRSTGERPGAVSPLASSSPPLQWIHVSGFGAVIFRRTTTQVRAEGGLWDESQELYSRLNGTPREQQLEWRFSSGAAVSFAHMEWERNRYDWQGSQICLIGFDELTHFSRTQFFLHVQPQPEHLWCQAAHHGDD